MSAGDATLTADRIFVNTGARATIPDIPGIDRVPYLTNTTLLDLDAVPDHLVIVGGSYVGLEFAQMFRRFGSRVTVLETGAQIVAREDADLAEAIAGILAAEGIDVRTHAECLSVEPVEGAVGTGVAVSFGTEGDGEPRHRVEGSHLLLAVGRTPNTDDLRLEAAGIARDGRGHIAVNDRLETSVPGVWALGDCNGQGAFTHTSYDDFQIVAANRLAGGLRRLGDRIPTYALYTDPPIGRAGLSERQVRESGRPAKIARLGMEKVGRARERGETQGFMKVLVDAETDRILGAAVLGIRGDEVVQGILDVMYAGGPYSTVRRAMHIHPTVAELVPTMLEDLRPLDWTVGDGPPRPRPWPSGPRRLAGARWARSAGEGAPVGRHALGRLADRRAEGIGVPAAGQHRQHQRRRQRQQHTDRSAGRPGGVGGRLARRQGQPERRKPEDGNQRQPGRPADVVAAPDRQGGRAPQHGDDDPEVAEGRQGRPDSFHRLAVADPQRPGEGDAERRQHGCRDQQQPPQEIVEAADPAVEAEHQAGHGSRFSRSAGGPTTGGSSGSAAQ